MQLESKRAEFEALGVRLAGMTYDGLDVLGRFHQEQNLGYPLMRDESAQHVKALNVLNDTYMPGDRAYGIPHPGIVFIGADGVVKLKFAVPGFRDRPPLDDVAQAVAAAIGQ